MRERGRGEREKAREKRCEDVRGTDNDRERRERPL